MARRVLLISINKCDEPCPVFPLGLGHVDAALRAAGYETRWADLRITGDDLSGIVRDFHPDFVGISIRNIDDVVIRTRETFYGPLTTICPQLRALSPAPIILGGSGFSIFPEQLMALAGADFGICGEGEGALVALLSAIEKGSDPTSIEGLVFRRGAAIIRNPHQQRSDTFTAASRPDDLSQHYFRTSGMLNVQTQRGCSHHCCYCTYPVIEGRMWRRRDPVEVAEELAALQASGARYVFIVDSVFNSSRAHATAVCEAILRRGVRMQWGCFLRPQGLTPELMGLMKRAGLKHIEFGSDSFSDAVLQAYDKRLTFDDIADSSELARQLELEFCHFLVCGGPGEDEATLRETFANSQLLKGAVILALVGMRIYPNTALYHRALREGVLPVSADLLTPQYYLSPKISEDRVFALLREFASRSPNWIVGDPSPEYLRVADRLRSRGVVGPLWSYFATMQRLALSFASPPGQTAPTS